MDGIHLAAWTCGGLLLAIILFFPAWGLYEKYRERNEPNVDETGATEDWADPDTGELTIIVKEVSYDRDSEPTGEIDMDELHTRLALEDAEIAFRKGADKVLGTVLNTLNNDAAWAEAIAARKAQKNWAKEIIERYDK